LETVCYRATTCWGGICRRVSVSSFVRLSQVGVVPLKLLNGRSRKQRHTLAQEI